MFPIKDESILTRPTIKLIQGTTYPRGLALYYFPNKKSVFHAELYMSTLKLAKKELPKSLNPDLVDYFITLISSYPALKSETDFYSCEFPILKDLLDYRGLLYSDYFSNPKTPTLDVYEVSSLGNYSLEHFLDTHLQKQHDDYIRQEKRTSAVLKAVSN